jgi:hypothetical protein
LNKSIATHPPSPSWDIDYTILFYLEINYLQLHATRLPHIDIDLCTLNILQKYGEYTIMIK